jgi:hypothetical protein
LAKFAAFWTALQRVGYALADAEKMTKNAEDTAWWRDRDTRHWAIATADEARAAVKICRRSLRCCRCRRNGLNPNSSAKTGSDNPCPHQGPGVVPV